MSGLTIRVVNKPPSNLDTIGTPLSATIPKTPTQFPADPPTGSKIEASKCWNEAKARFRTKVSGSTPRPSEEIVERFLKNNDRIDKTISECENLKSTADRQYDHSTSSRFIGKLLEVLVVVKNVGDPLLQCAPESVSIAWSAISLLISLGVNDIENCGRISEACANIVTIILNCRLYENRYQKRGQDGDEEAERVIIESVQELLSMVLDFFWYANRKLRDKKIKRFFKDIFDSKVNEKYEVVITQYKTLRESTELAFQERVMDCLSEFKKDRAELINLLFPALKDIAAKLDDLSLDVKNVLTEIQVRDKFKSVRKELKPTDTHQRQFEATLEPLRYGTEHLCQWLFKHKHYQSWEQIPRKPQTERDKYEKGNSEGKTEPVSSAQPSEKIIAPNFMYIKGRAGFGKSVMMALAIQRLKNGPEDLALSDSRPLIDDMLLKPEIAKEVLKPPVVYFFFKRGDDATQLTSKAFASLVGQLFDESYARTREEMERLMDAVSVRLDRGEKKEDQIDNETEREAGATISTSASNLSRIENIGRVLGRTIYIVIDGIDECTDFESEGLVGDLIKLGRSKKASFKILMSSREDMNLETQFAKDEEGQKILDPSLADDMETRVENEDPFHCVTHDDTTILTVTKETNSEDMKAYLDASLRQLMKRRLPRMFYSRKGEGRVIEVKSKRLVADISRMVSSIQQKSDGMFTYSAMIITSLDQPSPLSLTERLQNLPDGMDELYSRQLEALTGAERKLVTLALRRIIWSPTDTGTVEIAEEFKQTYLKEHLAGKEEDEEDYDDHSLDGSVAEESTSGQETTENQEPASPEIPNNKLDRRPSLHRSNTYPGENPIEKAMRSPEIADTVYHLEGVGRDFFKFSNEKQTIGLIHKSVRDWVEKESEKAAKRDYGIKSIASLFAWDKESDELKLTLPIPKIFVKGQGESIDFQSEKDTQLDILIYLMRVLIHPLFHETYMPYYPPEIKEPEESIIQEEKEASTLSDAEGNIAQDDEHHAEPEPNLEAEAEGASAEAVGLINLIEECPTIEQSVDLIKNSEDNERMNQNQDSVDTEITGTQPQITEHLSHSIHGSGEPLVSEEADESQGKEAEDGAELGVAEGDVSVLETTNNDVTNVVEEDLAQPQHDGNVSEASSEVHGTYHQGPWRGEIHQWPHHMKRVTELWPRDERHGEKWTELKDLLRDFSDPIIFRRWQVQYRQHTWENSLEEACAVVGVDPAHMTGIIGLPLYLEFLLEDEELKVDVTKLTRTRRTAIHFQDILYFPETVELVLKKGIDINQKDEDGETPFTVLLGCYEITQIPIERESESFNNLIKTMKLLIEAGADVNEPVRDKKRPVQAIIEIGDESLFDLIMGKENPKVDLTLTDSDQRTALHTVWESNENMSPEFRLSVARKLLEAGADPNAQGRESQAPLLDAVLLRHKDGIELLLDPQYGVNIDDEDNEGKTALIRLVSIYRDSDQETAITILNMLVKHGADINIRDKQMWTALMWSIWFENWDLVKSLLAVHDEKHGEDHSYLMIKDLNDRTILNIAASDSGGGLEMCKVVLGVLTPNECKGFLEEKDPLTRDRTALHIAIENDLKDIAIYLLDCGADPLACDSSGESIGDTFLETWISHRNNSEYNLKDELDVNNRLYIATKPRDTQNAYLHHAISASDRETIQKLSEAGIDPLKQDSEGWDAFDWAYVCGQQETMEAYFPEHKIDYETRKMNSKDKFHIITSWDPNRSHTSMQFFETENKCELSDDNDNKEENDDRIAVAANHPVNPYGSVYYYEVKLLTAAVEKGPLLGVGFAGENPPISRMPGWSHESVMSYGLHADDGRLFSPDTYEFEQQSKLLKGGAATYNVGDTVGCGYDLVNHQIFWTLNGKYLGVGFEDVKHRLYPFMAAKLWYSATANFGADPDIPFLWDGSREEPVQRIPTEEMQRD